MDASVLLMMLAFSSGCTDAYNTQETLPDREHRGAWIATVDNIDWPLTRESGVREQQNQLKYLIGQIHSARLNAIYFQVTKTIRMLKNLKSTTYYPGVGTTHW